MTDKERGLFINNNNNNNNKEFAHSVPNKRRILIPLYHISSSGSIKQIDYSRRRIYIYRIYIYIYIIKQINKQVDCPNPKKGINSRLAELQVAVN